MHLGTSKNEYLASAIGRSLALFPQIRHTLISDGLASPITKSSKVNFITNKVRVLESEITQRNINVEFRMGYWNLTLERIFAVLNYQIKNNLKNVLHVESDVILMKTFPFRNIQECKYVHWCEYGEGHDVASLLHIPDSQNAVLLKEKLLSLLKQNPNLTDMQLLFMARSSGTNIRLFPSTTTDNCGSKSKLSTFYCKCIPTNFIFDGLTYGMYLTGQDPRNNYGRYSIGDNSPFDSGATHLNPSIYSWTFDTSSTLQAECFCCRKVVILHNLHVHSKNLKLFGNDWSSNLLKLIRIANGHNRVNFFNGKVFYDMLRSSIRSGNTWSFISNSPPVGRLKRILLTLAKRK